MMDDTQNKPPMRRSVRILLILSLALNLIVVGSVGGAVLGHGGKDKRAHMSHDGPGSPIVRALTREDRRSMGRSIRKAYRSQVKDSAADTLRYQALVSALAADPYDPSAVKLAHQELDEANWGRRQIAQKIWLENVDAMSVEQRQDYAERIQEVLTNHKRGPKKGSMNDQ